MRKVSVALLAMLSLAVPSLSQDVTPESECGEAFKVADAIPDGVLTHTEIPKAACVKLAQAKQAEKQAASSPPAESPPGQTPPAK